ncbi:hypothetical protein OG235_24605 [Streptomyces sp. NBC_00024]|uniref:hypothetical protein n=1 Tax=Streptomyces sp. NBC_00024 TaxID=2903612 RepID=UPI003250AFA4
MTTRLYAHTSAAAAVLLALGACYTAAHTWWLGLSTLLTAHVFSTFARRCYTQARREQAIQQRLEGLKGLSDDEAYFELPPPCCTFWLHSDGEVHSPSECTRPAAARTTLTPAEEQAFTQITAALHRSGGAV